MAGSFDVFRRYQKSLLVFVAIMAMLAFFVLPPFLQMGSGTLAGDPLVARYSGGEIRESDLERAVTMRAVLNRFLMEAAVQAGRDPSRLPLFPESEDAVVRTRLLVEEARTVGIVVNDTAINDFLADNRNLLLIFYVIHIEKSSIYKLDFVHVIQDRIISKELIRFGIGVSLYRCR